MEAYIMLNIINHEHPLILVIEDDDSIREVITTLLHSESYIVKSASNGKEGLDLLSPEDCPRLIILDLTMPIMDGWEFLRIKNQIPYLTSVPVLVISAVADNQILSAGATAFLKKPVDVEVLLTIVKQFCS